MRSTKALRRRGPGGRLIAAPTVGTGVWWRCRGRCLHRPEPAAGGSHCRRRGLVLPPAGHFSPRKSAENAPGAAAPGLPLGLRGVHPRERHCASSCCPPSRPVPYCPPLPGFARASGIGWLLQLQNFSQRPHPLPRNRGSDCTRQFFRAISGSAVGARIARPLGCDIRVPPSNVPGNNLPVGAMPSSARAASAASRGGCGACERPVTPSHPQPLRRFAPPLLKGRLGQVCSAEALSQSRPAGRCGHRPLRENDGSALASTKWTKYPWHIDAGEGLQYNVFN